MSAGVTVLPSASVWAEFGLGPVPEPGRLSRRCPFLAKAEIGHGPNGSLGPAQLGGRFFFSVFFYDLNRKMSRKWFCAHFCSKSGETNFSRFILSRSTSEKYCMLILRYFSVELSLILVIAIYLRK
jgi:hypothetical protein